MFIVDVKTQKQRMLICRSCDKREKKFLRIFNAESCSLCKCNLKAKTSVSKQFGGECPIKKW